MSNEHEAIRRLSHDYADAVISRDPDVWGALWTDDAVWVLGPGREVHGRAAIVELWLKALGAYTTVVQLYQSSESTIDGDDAHGRAYLVELVEQADGARRTMVGYYQDTYRRTSERWLFASRELTVLYRGATDLSGPLLGAPAS